jgi:hypothetical protein
MIGKLPRKDESVSVQLRAQSYFSIEEEQVTARVVLFGGINPTDGADC